MREYIQFYTMICFEIIVYIFVEIKYKHRVVKMDVLLSITMNHPCVHDEIIHLDIFVTGKFGMWDFTCRHCLR